MRIYLNSVQPLGRALMLPIAVLPVAALLLRFGQPDLLDIAFIAAAGSAIFSNLGLLFAIGVAVGLARENHGAAGLAGMVCFLVVTEGAKALLDVPLDVARFAESSANDLAVTAWKAKELSKLSVPAGIASGLVSGWLYNRYATIRLPDYLGFFGGRRFVPIAAGLAGVIGALLFGLGFPLLEAGIDGLSHWVLQAGGLGLFLYGVLNRLLIVTGLHHILNNLAWFVLGDYLGATGDLNRFFAGDPEAGKFMTGFFPIMMFGLPAACLAMYRAARPERRRGVAGVFLSLGLTSFLTGITEPIEFTFMFLAPALYALHAVLTGVSMVVMDWLQVRLGFGFSAGLFDYVLNFGLATRPLLLLLVGAVYFGVYYFAFAWCIRRFDLKTPGREPGETVKLQPAGDDLDRARGYLLALGGASNLIRIEACTTRLRLSLRDLEMVDEPALIALGARGVVRTGGDGLQVVVGPVADEIATQMRAQVVRTETPSATVVDISAVCAAMGGRANIKSVETCGYRLLISASDSSLVDLASLEALFPRGLTRTPNDIVHVLTDGDPSLLNNLSYASSQNVVGS